LSREDGRHTSSKNLLPLGTAGIGWREVLFAVPVSGKAESLLGSHGCPFAGGWLTKNSGPRAYRIDPLNH